MTDNYNSENYAYSKIHGFKNHSYNIISYIMENNELIWKLLFYNEPDAWDRSPITAQQKRDLVYAGEPDETEFNVFMDEGQIDAWKRETSILRIYPYAIYPENRTVNTTTILFDFYSHYRINHMSDYTTRVDTAVEELMGLLNGVDIGVGLGKLFFNAVAAKENRIYDSGQIPYKGKRIAMSTKQG